MNQQQRNYLKRRINDVLQRKITEARAKCTTPGVTLQPAERIDLIRSGLVKMKPQKELNKIQSYSLNHLTNVFDFSKYEYKQTNDSERFMKIQKNLTDKANAVIDKVMLGDAQEAISMIEDFERFDGDC